LKRITTFRRTDNWINKLTIEESAFASANFPFGVITLYQDFYTKTTDDTERAMVLLHEVQHLQYGQDEAIAYKYVWQNRQKLGWTVFSHGMTETFITVSDQTREYSPDIFTCSANLWNDCTENLQTLNRRDK
jgi:hypothetical protein